MTLDTLYIVMAVQYFFWAFVFLFVKKENKIANIYLGLYLASHASLFYYFYQAYSGNYSVPSVLTQLYWISSAGHNPFLYLYILHYIRGSAEKVGKIVLHFIPALLITLMFTLYYFIQDESGRIELTKIHMSGESHNYLVLYKYAHISLFLQNMLYLAANFYLAFKYKQKLLNYTANPPLDRIKWIQELIVFTLIINIGGFVVFDMIPKTPMLRFYPLAHFIMIYYILYKAVNQSKVFEIYSVDHLKKIDGAAGYITRKPQKQIIAELKLYITTKELYKSDNLSIDKLSKDLGIPISLLIDSIKNEGQKNFYQFVNALRIEEIKKPENHEKFIARSIDDLSKSFGFNSEQDLKKCFMRYSHFSITEYQEQLINEERK